MPTCPGSVLDGSGAQPGPLQTLVLPRCVLHCRRKELEYISEIQPYVWGHNSTEYSLNRARRASFRRSSRGGFPNPRIGGPSHQTAQSDANLWPTKPGSPGLLGKTRSTNLLDKSGKPG